MRYLVFLWTLAIGIVLSPVKTSHCDCVTKEQGVKILKAATESLVVADQVRKACR